MDPNGIEGTGRRVDKSHRKMVKSDLLGGHSHETACGKMVHVWKRGETYFVRGRLAGRQFGDSLGTDSAAAAVQLRRVLAEMDDGTYLVPSEAAKSQLALARGPTPRYTFRQLTGEFLTYTRKQRGSQTAGDYKSRLLPLLVFAERPDSKRRWPLAAKIDSDFALEAKAFLFSHRTTANGRPGATTRPLSARQIVNVLQTLRTMLGWAASPANGRLPGGWVNPVGPETIGSIPLGGPALDTLTEAIQSKELDMRRAAIGALGALEAVAKPAVPAIIKLLSDKECRYDAIYALGRIGPAAEAAVPDLVRSLDEPEVRHSAIVSLGKIGPAAKAALPKLKVLATARERSLAQAATNVIAIIEGKAPIPSDGE